MTTARIDLPMDQIEAFCKKWHITEFALFGSVLRDDFRPDSDIDVLVTTALDAGLTLFDYVDMQQELEDILGRDVDLGERRWVERSENHIRRKAILQTVTPIYVAR